MIKLIFVLGMLQLLVTGGDPICNVDTQMLGNHPERLVVIKGTAMLENHPDMGKTAATNETIIFQRVGCKSCFVASNVDPDGNFKILVGDGKYRLIVINPGTGKDMVAPDQERLVDTGSVYSTKQEFTLDVKLVL